MANSLYHDINHFQTGYDDGPCAHSNISYFINEEFTIEYKGFKAFPKLSGRRCSQCGEVFFIKDDVLVYEYVLYLLTQKYQESENEKNNNY